MPDLLLELFSEEIPARMQRAAADNLKAAVTGALQEAGLMYDSAAAFVTPRRLTLTVTGIPVRSPDLTEEKKGPRVGAPQQALDGFLRAAGLKSIAEASIESDPKKGEFYVARVNKPGAPATELLSAILSKTIESFPWPKSMRWGAGRLNWVRPLRAITATFGPETEEPEIVRFSADGLESGQTTFGHRFLNPEPIKVRRFEDYAASLERAHVVLDRERRKDIIRADAAQLAFAQGLSVIADEGLVDEVAGLVEWPVVMMGSFDQSFLALPEEVIVTTIRANQKCFCLRDAKTGKLANRFVLTSNMLPADGGKTIVGGNERVIRARLSDAKFFYETDLRTKLEDGLETLKSSVFHAKLGSQFERIQRLEKLAAEIAPKVGADPEQARRAARLAKADLVTGMVGEFPELQGLMGRYYATAQGEPAAIATAIEMHYKPLGPTDQVPTEPVSIAVALADKLDLLTGFWSIDEKPTGSRDPFALRRAALGVIRILVENKLGYKLGVDADLLSFFHDRLKVMLRDQGTRHDLVDAVITPQSDDMLDIAQKAAALSAMLDTDTGKALLAGYRRAANILAAEEKKDGRAYADPVHGDELVRHEEINLAAAISDTHDKADACVAKGDYEGAIAALSGLQAPVDAFFEAVLVNDEDQNVRANRLNMLSELRRTMHLVADFSKVVG